MWIRRRWTGHQQCCCSYKDLRVMRKEYSQIRTFYGPNVKFEACVMLRLVDIAFLFFAHFQSHLDNYHHYCEEYNQFEAMFDICLGLGYHWQVSLGTVKKNVMEEQKTSQGWFRIKEIYMLICVIIPFHMTNSRKYWRQWSVSSHAVTIVTISGWLLSIRPTGEDALIYQWGNHHVFFFLDIAYGALVIC